MLGSLSWKNIWRNKLRSSVVIAAVALGVFAGVFMIALMNGMVDARIQSIIHTEMSSVQMHNPEFLANSDFSCRIPDADNIVQRVSSFDHVTGVSKRLVIISMVASAESNSGVKILGVMPDIESKVTNVCNKIVEGSYFKSNKKNTIVIGKKLAEKLKVDLNKKVVITLQDANMNITGGAFRVVGIYETDNTMFDESTVFTRYKDLCTLAGVDTTQAHEIAVVVDKDSNSGLIRNVLKFNYPKLDIQDWTQLSPEAGYLISAMNQYLYIFVLIIMLALCFGIVNTMLMAVLERVKELGMLMAIGMSKVRIFFMLMLETLYLSITGGFIGIISGYFLCRYLGKTGLDLYFWKEAYKSIGYSSMVYPKIELNMIAFTALMVVLTGILSTLYPAYKALKVNPANATRTK
ncbi:ABC transporter permease [uncultured Bacteroides sp.]|uniref:ABC transporter permease n=1 Tax=uncultured Bacteroides sp. TaxID=162156 RepID=UPI002AAB4646|nr:ABC transporter permease [uncultured Bacteroides sp.]